MVQVISNKQIRGLDLNSNPYSGVYSADYGVVRTSCLIADNAVLTQQRMIGNRKGFAYFTQGTSDHVDAIFEYQNYMVEHQADNKLYYGDATSGTRTQYTGTFTPPSPYRMDAAVGRGSLFFTSTAGPQKIDAYNHTPARAGITKALDVRGVTTGTGNGFANGYCKMAYHITWLRTDAQNQQVRSDVSSRIVVTNNTRQTVTITSAAGTATVTTPLAHGFSTNDLILISGATQVQYNGTFTATVTGATTFTYPVAGGPTSPATTTTTLTAERQMNVLLSFTVPWDVASGDSYEIWRSATMTASNIDPGDDCYLVTTVVNAGAAGATVTFTDTTPDNILISSTPLYTNASQQGALQGNARPPLCNAITTYKDYTMYAGAALDYQINVNLLAAINLVTGSSKVNIVNGTGTRTYTCAVTENVGTQSFQWYTGGLSNAYNIQLVVQSLCHVINGDSAGYYYAEYTAGPTSNPGLFRIWARSPTTGPFWLTASDATTGQQFTPTIPTSGQTCIATNDYRQNRLFYSKYQQPDAVPILNYIDIGRLDQPILRVLSVRDACYVIKADGVYYLSGLTAPFSLVELDTTCHCVAPATAVTLNNQVFFLSNQGVVKVSISGVTVISFDIESAIMISALPMSNLASVAFGISHEADRHYYLYLPINSGDTVCKQAYVYHTFLNQWVRWDKWACAGIALNSNYSLYLSSGLENAVLKQRKAGAQADYSDEELPVTVVSQTGLVVTLTQANGLFAMTAGVSLHQGATVAKATAATLTGGTTWNITLDRALTFTPGAATVRMPIYAHIRLSPNTCGDIGMVKTIYSVGFLLNTDTVTQATIEAATNESSLLLSWPITRFIAGGWGADSWGNVGWGDLVNPMRSIPWEVDMPIPDITGESVTSGFIHNVSQEQFVIAQVAFAYDQIAETITTA